MDVISHDIIVIGTGLAGQMAAFGAIFDRLQIYRIKHLPAPTPQGRAEQIWTRLTGKVKARGR